MNHKSSSAEDDRRLLAGCISGDRAAAEAFVRRFSNPVYQAVLYTFKSRQVFYNAQDLEDIHNTVFLELFDRNCRKLRQYQGKNGCSITSWLRIVAVRITLNILRKKGVDAPAWQKRRLSLEDLSELRHESVGPLARMEEERQVRLVQEGIQSLPPRDRLFMKLHFDQELPIDEVATALQISVQTAYTVKHRAIQRLKAYVADHIFQR